MAAYVDANAWIALYDPKDANHAKAKRMLRELAQANETLVVGLHTLYEVGDGFAGWFGQAAAAQAIANLRAAPKVRLMPSEQHLDAAVALLRSRPAWKVDLSDCLSFVMMREHAIQRAFTFDSDFKKAGFEVIP